MKEHIYLNNHKKAKSAALWLCLAALALLAAGAVCAATAGGHTLPSNVFFCLGAVACLCLAAFTLHYIRHNEESRESGKHLIVTPHLFAVGAVFTVAHLFAGGFGSFSYSFIHAFTDGFLAAMLVKCTVNLFGKKSWIAALAGIAAGVLSLLWLDAALHVLLIVLAVVLAVASVMRLKWAKEFALGTMLLALVVAGFAVAALVQQGPQIHMLLHFAALAAGCATLVGIVCTLSPAVPAVEGFRAVGVKQEKTEEPAAVPVMAKAAEPETETKPAPAAKKAAASKPKAAQAPAAKKEAEAAKSSGTQKKTKKAAGKPAAAQDDVFDRDKWIIKKYHGLSAPELLNAPVDALYGVSAGDAKLFKDAFNIKTIGDLANNKFFAWAQEIVEEADAEK